MPTAPSPKLTRFALATWCLTLAIVLIVRILAPSDLGQNLDQSKTIAFTLDMVHNNQWVLPSDSLGHLTRKPPMINWLGAPFVALGLHSELALKLPAVISGISISLLIFFAARFLFRKLDTPNADAADRTISTHATPLAMLASAAWLASPSAIKHIYFMRPDILFTALLFAGWLASIVVLSHDTDEDLDNDQPKKSKLALLIWFLGACAILTKGPLAILIPLYLLLHILILTPKAQRKAAIASTRWQWGLPIMILIPAVWLLAAHRINPDHVTGTLFGTELAGRVGTTGYSGILNAALKNPAYFYERFLPWCLPATLAIICKPSSKLRSHPLAPASLWVLLVIGFTTITSLSAGSYIMPAYPAAAMLAVYSLFRIVAIKRHSIEPTRIKPAFVSIAIIALLFASLITAREATLSRGARTHTGEHIKAFAQSASIHINADSIRFSAIGDIPIASLLGRFQPGEIDPVSSHHWLIQPTHLDPNTTPIITSGLIVTHDPATGIPIDHAITLSLYRLNP